jgi:hypothetical protein
VPPPGVSQSFDVGTLSRIGIKAMYLMSVIYPDSSLPDSLMPKGEFIVAANQEFTVKITGLSPTQSWQWSIEDRAVTLARVDSSTDSSRKTLSYTFKASGRCKGSIGLAEIDLTIPYGGISNRSHGLFVSYDCEMVQPATFTLDHQEWSIDSSITNFTILELFLSGKSNAVKLKVETYGDGARWANTLVPESDGTFSDTLSIAFSYGSSSVRNLPGTRIAVYGAPGYPEIRSIPNPLRTLN